MKKRGFSLLETMLAVTVLGFVLAGSAGLIVNVIRSFNWTTSAIDADQSASMAMQKITRDLQPAKQVVVQSPTSLLIYYPFKNADGTYTKTILDTTNTVQYYRGNANGVANPTGAYILRKPALSAYSEVTSGVTNLQFTSPNPANVTITLGTNRKGGTSNVTCDLVQRAVFLRNY
ncbi:MAG: prepilin-type N-terminal cleavage/methylation domain-containing protein [Fimbriimonadaceae bacterium]